MSEQNQLEAFVASLEKGQSFTIADIRSLGVSSSTADLLLNKMCGDKRLIKARRGQSGGLAKWTKA